MAAGRVLRSPARRDIVARLGSVPEWPKGADCKSAGYAYEGSNPSRPTFSGPRRVEHVEKVTTTDQTAPRCSHERRSSKVRSPSSLRQCGSRVQMQFGKAPEITRVTR